LPRVPETLRSGGARKPSTTPDVQSTTINVVTTEWVKYQNEEFRILWRWKEVVEYWEGDHGIWFMAGWGVTPHVMSVPTAATWDSVVPDWLKGRHAEVVGRLIDFSEHVVDQTDLAYGRPGTLPQ
jgi:hypothetical protein